jgi:adenosine deaminase
MLLHRAGVRVTINTDDPMIQGTWMADDIRAASTLGASEVDLQVFDQNAVDAAFLAVE